eukprot:TRINITY_DN549_c0_g1_i2.p1 TRINITY_DN549_c0_g1~~TRINITY_DN549_c0_g1_i2.p1  ORF type:complete len:1521 (+),score=366.02 TRINITY_DN549_c0_g1_i2:89-4651(+)
MAAMQVAPFKCPPGHTETQSLTVTRGIQIGQAVPKPQDQSISRGAVAVGFGLCSFLTHSSRRKTKLARNQAARSNVSEGLNTILLGSSKSAQQLSQYFSINGRSVQQQFSSMTPMLESECESDRLSGSNAYMSEIGKLISRGYILSKEHIHYKEGDMCHHVMTINTDAGIACGFGAATNKKHARQVAAASFLRRFSVHSNVSARLKQAADTHEKAKNASDLLDAFTQLDKASMKVIQPFGDTYCASLTAGSNDQKISVRSPNCASENEAIAMAGEAFEKKVRDMLRIKPDAPFEPQEWADAFKFDLLQQDLELPSCGSAETEKVLHELICQGIDRDALKKALDAAKERQAVRLRALEQMITSVDEDVELPAPDQTARRCFEVTSLEDDTWRREEIKGKLPAEKIRLELNQALERHQAVIVSGGTGSGKSTQLPQFVLDDWRSWELEGGDQTRKRDVELEVGKWCEVFFEEKWYPCEILEVSEDKTQIGAKYEEGGDEEWEIDVKERVRAGKPAWQRKVPRIIVTQPRRLAALSLAERVAWERNGETGGEIGYAMRGDSKRSESDTGTIDFTTVGVILRMLVQDPLLMQFNVVVLDEVHERDLMTDFALILLKDVLERRKDLRLILMSATLDVDTFTSFLPQASVVEVPSGTRFPVEEIHLEDSFFEQIPEARNLLEGETTYRQQAGVGSEAELHDFSSTHRSEQDARQQLDELISSDKAIAKTWKEHSKKMLSGRKPADVDADDLRDFLNKVTKDDSADDEEEEGIIDGKPSLEMLQDQVGQMTSFSDDIKTAWQTFKDEKGELGVDELLEFLELQGVKPFSVGQADWEITSSFPWWGSDNGLATKSLMSVAEATIAKVYPEMLNEPEDDEFGTGSILVFLPGWAEIKQLGDMLEKGPHAEKLWVVRVHSQVSKEEQQQAFEKADPGTVKVVLATNIAESSVTIDDVRTVIDAGLHREMTYDPKNRMSHMDTVWICQSNAVQRKGRAGRVRSGKVYRLYSQAQFRSVPWRPPPEMQRCNLASTCMQTISLGRDPREFLAKAPDPPPIQALEAAMAELSCMDAIVDGNPPLMQPLGQLICRFPLQPMMGRAMVLGALFGIPDRTAALILMGDGGVFKKDLTLRSEVLKAKKQFCDYSDTLASLRAFAQFEEVCRDRGCATAERFADHFHLNYNRCISVSRQKFMLLRDVQRSGLLDAAALDGMNPDEWYQENWGGEGGEGEEGGEEGEGGDEEAAEQYQESAGAIFESGESAQLSADEWTRALREGGDEVVNYGLLAGILCAASPMNIAFRESPKARLLKTRATEADIDKQSVNSVRSDDNGPSWWTYQDLRMFNGQSSMSNTTKVEPWQVAVFAGMRSRDKPHLELDGWIGLKAESKTEEVVRALRTELRDALASLAMASSFDKMATAMVARSKALFTVIGQAFTGQELDEDSVSFLKSWSVPEIKDGEVLEKPAEDCWELEELLKAKKKPELKVMVGELGLPMSGNKNVLIDRLVEHWFPGYKDQEGGDEGEGEGEYEE